MPGRVDGKVAFITGAARGMGRSHAVRLAEEGADIIAVDICAPLRSAPAPPSTEQDLSETAKLVEATGRRVITARADVRDEDELAQALARGVAELGRLDIVVANAGIGGVPGAVAEHSVQSFRDVIDVNLVGVFITAKVAVPHLRAHGHGGALILISSALGLRGMQNVPGYVSAKHGGAGLMKSLAIELAADSIRVNSIHPTNVATPLIHNQAAYRLFRPDLDDPGLADVREPFQALNLLPVPWIEPADVSEAVLYLAADSGRYVTGTSLVIDAGWTAK